MTAPRCATCLDTGIAGGFGIGYDCTHCGVAEIRTRLDKLVDSSLPSHKIVWTGYKAAQQDMADVVGAVHAEYAAVQPVNLYAAGALAALDQVTEKVMAQSPSMSAMCERKTADIMQREGYAKTGYVLMAADPAARICVSDQGAVAWFTRDEWNWLMHNRDHVEFAWPKPFGAAPQQHAQAAPSFDTIEDAFPEGAQVADDGHVTVTPAWLHQFARNLAGVRQHAQAALSDEQIRIDLMRAAINCGHSIESEEITLQRHPRRPGNALAQLADRLLEAHKATLAASQQPVAAPVAAAMQGDAQRHERSQQMAGYAPEQYSTAFQQGRAAGLEEAAKLMEQAQGQSRAARASSIRALNKGG